MHFSHRYVVSHIVYCLLSLSSSPLVLVQYLSQEFYINPDAMLVLLYYLSQRYGNNYHGQMYYRSESLSKFFSFLMRVHEEWVFGMGGAVWWIWGWRGGLLGETVIGSRCKLVRVGVEVKWGRRGEGTFQKILRPKSSLSGLCLVQPIRARSRLSQRVFQRTQLEQRFSMVCGGADVLGKEC